MKKNVAFSMIAVLAVVAVIFAVLFFANNSDKTKKIDELTAEATEKTSQIEALNADAADKASQIEALNADAAEKAGPAVRAYHHTPSRWQSSPVS